jgi:hypothetical protein
MIEKFKKLPHFIKYMWSGFEFVAQIEERQEKLNKAKGAAIKLLQLGVQKLLKVNKKEEPISSKEGIRMDYCDEITNNREQIKLKSIDYLEKILRIYFKVINTPKFNLIGKKSRLSLQPRYPSTPQKIYFMHDFTCNHRQSKRNSQSCQRTRPRT